MENKSRVKNEESVDEAFAYFRVLGHNTAGLGDPSIAKDSFAFLTYERKGRAKRMTLPSPLKIRRKF